MTTKSRPQHKDRVREELQRTGQSLDIAKEQRGKGLSAMTERQLDKRLSGVLKSMDESLEKVGTSLDELGLKRSEIRDSISKGVSGGINTIKQYAANAGQSSAEEAFREGLKTFVSEAKKRLNSDSVKGAIYGLSELNKKLQESVDNYLFAQENLERITKLSTSSSYTGMTRYKGAQLLGEGNVDEQIANVQRKELSLKNTMLEIQAYKPSLLESVSQLSEIHATARLAGEARTAFGEGRKSGASKFIDSAKAKDYAPEFEFAKERPAQRINEMPEETQSTPVTANPKVKTNAGLAQATESGTVTWGTINSAKIYYEEFEKWADLDGQQRAEFKALINNLEKTHSLKDSVELWKRMNVIWLEKTDTIEGDAKADLLERTMNATTSKEIMNISREALARHVNYYAETLLEQHYFTTKKALTEGAETGGMEEIKRLVRENQQIWYSKPLNQMVPGEKITYGEILEKNQRKLNGLLYYDAKKKFYPLRTNSEYALELKNFYENLEKMNSILSKNMIKPAEERDFSGNDIMWNFMFWYSFDSYRRNLLPPSPEKREIKMPPPPQEPTGEKNISMPPPQEPTKQKNISTPPPVPEQSEKRAAKDKQRQDKSQQAAQEGQGQKAGNSMVNIGDTNINGKPDSASAKPLEKQAKAGAGKRATKENKQEGTQRHQQVRSMGSDYDGAKVAYSELFNKGATAADHFYANIMNQAGNAKDANNLTKQSDGQEPFVVFPNANGSEGYAFPNPRLKYKADELRLMFPDLTEDKFNNNKESIEPVKIRKITQGWEPALQ